MRAVPSRHPGIGRWADYVRGLGDPGGRRRLGRHLEAGCARCAGRVAALRRVLALAEVDARLPVPASVLRSVKILAKLDRPDRRVALDAVAFGLRHDSATAGSPAGMRTGDPPAYRVLLFAVEGCQLDLSVEPAAGAGSGRVMTGTCVLGDGAPLAGAQVVVVAADEIVGVTTTGELGDFQFTEVPAERLEIWLAGGAERPLVADLDLAV